MGVKTGYRYGVHCVIESNGVLLQAANCVDNNMDELYDNEILIDVRTLNIDSANFTQIEKQAMGDEKEMRRGSP